MRASEEALLSKGERNIRKLHYLISRIFLSFYDLRLLRLHSFMFLTNDANKHPLSDSEGKGNHVWMAAEIQLRFPVFIVEFEQPVEDEGDDFTYRRTVLLARGDDVLRLISTLVPQTSLKSVALMTPASEGAGSICRIDQLTAIWEAEDPFDSHLKYKIFSKLDGSHHVDSLMSISAYDLQDWRQLSLLPTAN